MPSLLKTSGLPIEMRDDYSLDFGPPLSGVQPEVRVFSALKNFFKNPASQPERREIYFRYADLALPSHRDALLAAGLTYGLLVMPPGRIGDEFVRTPGHYHSVKASADCPYPEVWEVVWGSAIFLLQKPSADFGRISEACAIEAKKGDKVLIPPGYGHININAADEVLVLSWWQARASRPLYEAYESRNGGAYYVIESRRLAKNRKETVLGSDYVPNLNYNSIPELLKRQARALPQYNLLQAIPMYFSGTKNPESLKFLTAPENYTEELIPEKLFK